MNANIILGRNEFKVLRKSINADVNSLYGSQNATIASVDSKEIYTDIARPWNKVYNDFEWTEYFRKFNHILLEYDSINDPDNMILKELMLIANYDFSNSPNDQEIARIIN